MGQYARVNSVVMLKQLRSALASFSQTAATALDEVSTDIQRTLSWLHEDRRRYWKNQVRLRTEQYVQAKLALKRKGVFDIALTGMRTTAVDEKKALAIAERRLQEAKRRLARTQSWILRIEKELSDYRAGVQGLSGAIDLDIPNARARLEKMVESLEAYAALAPPEMATSAEETLQDSVLQPVGDQATVFRTAASDSETPQDIQALRETTPSQEMRDSTAISSDPVDWLAQIRLSDNFRQALQEVDFDAAPPQPEEKVLVALPKGEPSIVYLEHREGKEGDSGWYVGVGGHTDIAGYSAMRVETLLGACPDLKGFLSLPVGSIALVNTETEDEFLFDAQDNVLWESAERDGAASEEDGMNQGE